MFVLLDLYFRGLRTWTWFKLVGWGLRLNSNLLFLRLVTVSIIRSHNVSVRVMKYTSSVCVDKYSTTIINRLFHQLQNILKWNMATIFVWLIRSVSLFQSRAWWEPFVSSVRVGIIRGHACLQDVQSHSQLLYPPCVIFVMVSIADPTENVHPPPASLVSEFQA